MGGWRLDGHFSVWRSPAWGPDEDQKDVSHAPALEGTTIKSKEITGESQIRSNLSPPWDMEGQPCWPVRIRCQIAYGICSYFVLMFVELHVFL